MSTGSAILRVGTHNVRSLAPSDSTHKATALAALWKSQNLDIIFLQEHRVTNFFTINSLRHTALKPWRVYFNTNKTHRGGASCAILIRRRLISNNLIRIQANSKISSSNGRLLSIKASWGGHTLQLVCVHLPNAPGRQKEFIDAHLKPLALSAAAVPNMRCIWGGDFNFVHNPSLDRIQRVTINGTTQLRRPPETTSPVGIFWATSFPNLTDIYRSRHPTGRDMSRFDPGNPAGQSPGAGGSARLDRFYVSPGLLSTSAGSSPSRPSMVPNMNFSDHLLVTMDVVARIPGIPRTPPPPPPHWRKRINFKPLFFQMPHLVEAYEAQLLLLVDQAPTDSLLLLGWYPNFKRQWVNLIIAINQQYKTESAASPPSTTAEMKQAYEAVVAASNAQLPAALEAYNEAHQMNTSAAAARHARQMGVLARYFIHKHEFPNPTLTLWLAPNTRTVISAIRGPSGALITNPVRCGTLFGIKYAYNSRLPTTNAEAQSEVMTTLQQHPGPRISSAAAAALGTGTVTIAEVQTALKETKAGTSPGPDGIPVDFYLRSSEMLAPLLARVYSAIHAHDAAPPSFSEGVISPLYKLPPEDPDGDITNSDKYRPITLLDLDYRLLAKILASRLKPLLPEIIHPHQSAFIDGRNIGDCNWLTQFIGPLLRSTQQPAALLLCDIAKAYDTVDREFLWKVMAEMGVGDDFLKWMKILHRDTKACATVRGYLGDTALFFAGVRQGCPLAALLFLFVIIIIILFFLFYFFWLEPR